MRNSVGCLSGVRVGVAVCPAQLLLGAWRYGGAGDGWRRDRGAGPGPRPRWRRAGGGRRCPEGGRGAAGAGAGTAVGLLGVAWAGSVLLTAYGGLLAAVGHWC